MARITRKIKQTTQNYDDKGQLILEKNPYYFDEILKITCDICGKEGSKKNDWSPSYYDIQETEVCIKYKSGEAYPEGGQTNTVEYDICPKCFTTVLVPFLDSKGCSSHENEQDW